MTRIYTDDNGVYANAFVTEADGTDVKGHKYYIQSGIYGTLIDFQHGPVKEVGVNGMTSEALLAVLIHRTEVLNSRFPCEENELAIESMKGALALFNLRTERRKARGVADTHQV